MDDTNDDMGSATLAGESVGKNIKAAAFVPSRWETVDPHEAEEQAMTTSKWEMLERENKNYNSESIDQDSPDDDFNETRYFKIKKSIVLLIVIIIDSSTVLLKY